MALPKLFVVGDSISLQYGPFLKQVMRGVFDYARKSGEEAALKNLDIPVGGNGGDSERVLEYLEAMVKDTAWQPDVLQLNCGLHDIKTDAAQEDAGAKQVPLVTYRDNLEAIAALVADKRPTTRLVWVRTTPVSEANHNGGKKGFNRYNADVEAYNAEADAVLGVGGAQLLDLHTFSVNLGDADSLMPDGVHYIESAQAQQAAYIAGFLQRLALEWISSR